jgi:hypothetical protein
MLPFIVARTILCVPRVSERDLFEHVLFALVLSNGESGGQKVRCSFRCSTVLMTLIYELAHNLHFFCKGPVQKHIFQVLIKYETMLYGNGKFQYV